MQLDEPWQIEPRKLGGWRHHEVKLERCRGKLSVRTEGSGTQGVSWGLWCALGQIREKASRPGTSSAPQAGHYYDTHVQLWLCEGLHTEKLTFGLLTQNTCMSHQWYFADLNHLRTPKIKKEWT